MIKSEFLQQFVVLLPLLASLCFFDWVEDVVSAASPFDMSLAVQQFVVTRAVEELSFYWLHRLLHWGPLYERVHKVHHEFRAPYTPCGQFSHWIEGVFVFDGCLVYGLIASCFMLGRMHVITLCFCVCYAVLRSTDGHSGWYVPWQIDYWPLARLINGGAPHHDFHHQKFHGNYGELWIDWLFGTLRWQR